MSDTNLEVILAEEQSVTCKADGKAESEGTLVLTSKRLIFVRGNVEEDLKQRGIIGVPQTMRFRFADVSDLSGIPQDPANLSIELGQIETEKGTDGIIRNPGLKIKWHEGAMEKKAEFSAEISSGRKKSLKDWARVIEGLKSGKLVPTASKGKMPSQDSLEWKIISVLGDMQEKGVFEIEEQVEGTFKVDLDPDQVEDACEKLVALGFLDKIPDASGDNFYRKRSPLGEDDLST